LEEARNLNHTFIGTEHILLGLLREQGGIAAQVLGKFGLTLEDARNEIIGLHGAGLEGSEQRGIVDECGLFRRLGRLIARVHNRLTRSK